MSIFWIFVAWKKLPYFQKRRWVDRSLIAPIWASFLVLSSTLATPLKESSCKNLHFWYKLQHHYVSSCRECSPMEILQNHWGQQCLNLLGNLSWQKTQLLPVFLRVAICGIQSSPTTSEEMNFGRKTHIQWTDWKQFKQSCLASIHLTLPGTEDFINHRKHFNLYLLWHLALLEFDWLDPWPIAFHVTLRTWPGSTRKPNSDALYCASEIFHKVYRLSNLVLR